MVRNLYPVCQNTCSAWSYWSERKTLIPSVGFGLGFSFNLLVPLKIISIILAQVVIACFRVVASFKRQVGGGGRETNFLAEGFGSGEPISLDWSQYLNQKMFHFAAETSLFQCSARWMFISNFYACVLGDFGTKKLAGGGGHGLSGHIPVLQAYGPAVYSFPGSSGLGHRRPARARGLAKCQKNIYQPSSETQGQIVG